MKNSTSNGQSQADISRNQAEILGNPKTATPASAPHPVVTDRGIELPPFKSRSKSHQAFEIGDWAIDCGLWLTLIKAGVKGPRYKDWGRVRRSKADVTEFGNRNHGFG